MTRVFPLNLAKQTLREKICPRCPLWRGVATDADHINATCEAHCPLFHEVDRFARVIESRDMMLSTRRDAINDATHALRLRAGGHPTNKPAPECFRLELIPILKR